MAQAPAKEGVRTSGKHWVNDKGNLKSSGNFLEKFLNTIGYSIDPHNHNLLRPYTTNVLHCWTGRGKKRDISPNKDQLINCRNWWLKEIKLLNPGIIILVGQKSVKSFAKSIGENLSFADLLRRQGEDIKIEKLCFKRFVVPHPTSPYREKHPPYRSRSEIYEDVFQQIKLLI